MKKFLKLLLLPALILMVSACGNKEEQGNDGTSQKGWPVTYKDATGENVEIKEKPKKVVVLHFGYSEYLLSLGLTPAGSANAERLSTFKTLDPYKNELKEIVNVGEVKNPDLEKILEIEPDLIIALPKVHEGIKDNLNKIATTVFLNDMGGAWEETLNEYATILGRQDEASKYIEKTKNTLSETRDKIKSTSNETFLILRPSANNTFMVAGSKISPMYFDKEKGFGLKYPENNPSDWETISLEAIMKLNPDNIIFADEIEKCKGMVDNLNKTSAVWKKTKAVKNNKIQYLDVSVNTGSPLAIDLTSKDLIKWYGK